MSESPTSDSEPAATTDAPAKTRRLSRSTLAAGLTAICTVMVALSAFLSAAAASDSDDQYALAGQRLEDANFWYEQGADVLREDLRNFFEIEVDQYCAITLIFDGEVATCAELDDDDLAEVIAWVADDDVLEAANANQDLADDLLAKGLENSAKAVDYQAALVMFATGLALSAWASLSDTSKQARRIFVVLSIVSLAGGFLQLLAI